MKNPLSKSSDPLGISAYMINMCMCNDLFVNTITNLLYQFLISGNIPSILKLSCIVPVPKVDNPVSPNQTRPTGIQPVITKFLEKCILSQLTNYIESNNILSSHQFGFRKKLSTSHALIALTDFLYNEIDKNNICILLSLDFQKAFDKVDRDILLYKMAYYGINCPIFQSLLYDRKQFVSGTDKFGKVNKSQIRQTETGVIQGSSVSAILFCIMINDLPLYIKNSCTYMFADDSNLAISGKPEDIHTILDLLEDDLGNISNWLSANRIQLNIDKTHFMVIGKHIHTKKLPDLALSFNGCSIKQVKSMKILGVIIDENLSWTEHLKHVTKKCYSSLSQLYSI